MAATAMPPQLDRAPAPTIRARGVELLGQMAGSGYRDAPQLVRRGDGHIVQLTPLLYCVLEAIDGDRSDLEIAWEVASRTGKVLTAGEVAYLIGDKLRPLGLAGHVDEHAGSIVSANPLLALRFRFVVSNPRVTGRVTAPFALLFRPAIVVPALAAFAAVVAWVLVDKGLGAALHEAIYEPEMLLLVFALTALSAGFHEFGHAAACRYGGANPGAMGAALYLVWPAFYTDVTDSYRLDRRGRLRVDLGGLYFNALFAVVTFLAWWLTRADALLLVVPIQLLQMVRQLVPVVRFDGYHILADLTGVPDLFARIGPTLRGVLPRHWHDPETKTLKPWARAVVTGWVVVVVPLLAFSLVMMVLLLPRVAATAWDSVGLQFAVLRGNFDRRDWMNVAARMLSIVAIALPPLGTTYLLARIVRRGSRTVWRAADGRSLPQALLIANLVLALSVAGVALWPDGQYVPVGADERAAAGDAFGVRPHRSALDGDPVAHRRAEPRRAATARVRRSGLAASPQDAVIPVPRTARTAVVDGDLRNTPGWHLQPAGATGGARAVSPWPFPFPPPPAPRAGDNFAVAVNTVDGNAVTDMASSLLWLETDRIDNRNRSYALARCVECTTSATAFQVIIASGDVTTAIPENSAVAVNYQCTTCVTHSVAIQLVVTLDGAPTPELRERVGSLWSKVRALEGDAAAIAPLELRSRLLSLKAEFISVLRPDADAITSDTETEGDAPDGDEHSTLDPDGDGMNATDASTTTTTADPALSGSPSATEQPSATTTTTAGDQAPTTEQPATTTTTEPPPSTTTTGPPAESTTTSSP